MTVPCCLVIKSTNGVDVWNCVVLGHFVAVECCYKMPPRRRSSRASQKETDERLSIAETIAGLANSFEQPAFTPHDAITRQNSHNDMSGAEIARLPSMVVEEVAGSVAVAVSSALPAGSVSVNGAAHAADLGRVDLPSHKLRSQDKRLQLQSQPSTGDVVNESQLTSTVGMYENVTSSESGHLHTDTVNCSVFSAVLMGWNPPVLASCPSASIESVSADEVSSPLSALTTVHPANNDSNVEVLKLPLVLEPVSDGTWLLVPMSASAAFGAGVLPNNECVIQTVAQHSGQSAYIEHSSHPVSSSMSEAGVADSSSVSNESVTAVDNSRVQFHSLGSISVLGSYYNGSGGYSPGRVARSRQQLSGIVNNVSCSDRVTSVSGASSNEELVSGSSVLGSLGALRDYYKRISTDIIQSRSLTAADICALNSTANVASVGNNEISCTDTLSSKIPAVSMSVCNDQVTQPVPCIVDARNIDIQTQLNVKRVSTCSVAASADDDNLSLRNTSRVLPAVSVGHRQKSYDSTDKQLRSESNCNPDVSKHVPTLSTDEGSQPTYPEHSYQLLRHLPPKKRQKVCSHTHCESEGNSCQHNTLDELGNQHSVDDYNKNASVDAPDISLNEEIVTHTEQPVSATFAVSGTILVAIFL